MSNYNEKRFANFVKKAREKQGMSLQELENQTGISASYIFRLEKGQRKNPTMRIAGVLMDALGEDKGWIERCFFDDVSFEDKMLVQRHTLEKLNNDIQEAIHDLETGKESNEVIQKLQHLVMNLGILIR